MNKIRQFCFHPYGKDRYVWAWIQAVLAFLMVLCFLQMLHLHRYGWAIVYVFLTAQNVFFCWLNHTLYLEWKQKENDGNWQSHLTKD